MKRFFKTMAFTLLGLVLSVNLWAADPVVLFHETFGDNSGSARAWSDTYSVKSGVADVYSSVSYTMTNVKQGKNTTGQTKSGLNQSAAETDAVFEFGPLDVSDYETLKLSYYWKAASTKGTYTTKISYKTSKSGSYSEITPSATGATTFVQVSENLPSAVDKCGTLYLKIVFNTSNTQAIIDEVELTGVFDGVAPTTPSLSVSPETIDFGEVEKGATVEGKEVTVTMTNVDEVLVGFSTNSPFSVDKESLTVSGTVIVTPTQATLANAGEYSDELIVTDADKLEKKVVVSIKVKEPAAPTGTFNKFTGETLKEGDYVLVYSNNAVSNVLSSNKLQSGTFTLTDNAINNPDESIIWHIAASETHWTIYSEAAEKYAGGSTSKNNAALLDEVTNYALWDVTIDTEKKTYDFANVGRAGGSSDTGNKWLHCNTGASNVWAPYASSTGGALTLYKKYVEPAKNKVTVVTGLEHGTIGATPASGTLESVEEDVVVTLTNTPASGYKLDAYDVYKTGESETKVTVKEESGVYTFKMPAYDVTVSATFSLSIETPVLSEAAGDKNDAINVKVSNYNSNYSYYYTLDGNDPTNASTPYVDADGIAINASCTLKVIAYQDAVTSPVASAAYNLPLMTMDAIFAAATAAGKTATNARVKFTNCVVTGVKNDNVYLTDNAGKGLIIYQSGHGFAVNDKLNGVVNVQVLLYNGSSEIKGLTSSTDGLTVTKDGSVTPITNIGIASLSGVNTGAVLSYENLVFDGDKSFSDGTNTIQPYNNFSIENYPTFENGDKYNVTGVYIQYSNTKEIAPRALTDLEKIEATKYAINLASVEHGTIATDPETEAADGVKVTLSASPATGYMLSAWSVVDAESTPIEVVNNEFTMPAKAVTVSATFVELPIWATTYTSNVTVGSDKVRFSEDGDQYDAKKAGSSNSAGSTTITIPAGTYELHYHAAAWSSKSETLYVKNGNTSVAEHSILADAGLKNNTPFTLENNPVDEYYMIKFEPALTEETTLTFSASSNRFVLFGVNAIQPAAITIDPASKDFGEVKENVTSDPVEFTLTPNAFATGEITAEIEGEGFSASSSTVENNQVTVTFAPTEIKEYSATLIIKHDGTQMCTAALSGTGISATTPEIIVSAEEIDFGEVKQDASVASQQVMVTLNYLDAATASISEGAFTIDKTNLVIGDNTITISATASSMGEKSATITITGTGATTKTIAVTMEVTSKWAGEYTSNVEVKSDKVIIDEVEYDAVKAGSGSSAGLTTITVPEGAYALHFHAAGWNNEDVTLAVKNGDTELGSFSLYKDAGVKNNSPFTLAGENYDTNQYFYVEFDALEEETDLTFAATSGNRFVLYGVNQEGGLTKELSAIEVSGTPNKLQYTEGVAFDPTGLTVMGTFTFGEEILPDKEDVTAQVTDWVVEPTTLASNTISVSVIAKVDEIASEAYTVENIRVLPENTDMINASTGTATTSTYKAFTATGLTNTRYAGKTALNDNNLTLSNATTSHPGIVSTYTIGYIKSVKVTIVDGNTRNLDIYGSHRAYQSAEDLYSLKNAIRGTKIGTLTASGVLDLSEAETKYEFIGIRSEDGAIQVPEIQITWTPVEFLRISVAENIEGGTIDIDRTVATAEEVGNVQVTIEPTPNEGLQFDKLVIYNESDEDVTALIAIAESGLAFTMPNYNVKVGATFKSQPVTAISLDKSAITVDKNSTETLTASFLPKGAFTDVTWTSADEAIATVEDGVVTGKGQGTTTITASCNDGALTATCSVTVNAQPEYELVTNATSLQDGDVIVLGNAANNAVNGGYNTGKYLDKEVATITEGVLTSNDLMEITLCKTDAGWNLVTEQGHLGAIATKNLLINKDYTDWTISISGNDGNPATISAGEDQGRFLYNVNNPRFLNYSSATSAIMLLPEIYRLSNDTKKVVKLMDKNNVYAIYRVREGENVTLSVALPSGCTKGWIMDGKTYAKNATIENVTADMVLYAIQSEEIINEDKEISSKDVNQGSTITIGDGTNETNVIITSDDTQEKAHAYQIVVKKNATVTISAPAEINNLEVEDGAKIIIEEDALFKSFTISATRGENASSGQVINADNLTLNGDAYFDLTFDENEVSAGWYAFTVPFKVNSTQGVYNANTGDKLTNEVDYAIMQYQGAVRAQGLYGWIKTHKAGGMLYPGTLYIITLGDTEYNRIRFVKADGNLVNTEVEVKKFALDGGVSGQDNGWNGVGNPTLAYGKASNTGGAAKAQFLDHENNVFVEKDLNEADYEVGAAFFIQAGEDATMSFAPEAEVSLAPARQTVNANTEFMLELSNAGAFQDRLFVSANDEALPTYEIGHDLIKMGAVSGAAKVAQMAVKGYNNLTLCDAEFELDDNNQALFPLTLTAPMAGTYTLSVERAQEGATLYLMHNGAVIWNLSNADFDIDLTKGTNTEYSLLLMAAPKTTPTGWQEVKGAADATEKFIYKEKLYLLRKGVLYDATGKKIK